MIALVQRLDFHRGDLVYDKADKRHVGTIRFVSVSARTATIRWLETGWLSVRVPIRDLRRARGERAVFKLKKAD